ncbi:MAG TPA: hypothetical protein VHL80_16110 [Polyangia bacterium]|nr:hypothetical protein [Polyangia bacterium]
MARSKLWITLPFAALVAGVGCTKGGGGGSASGGAGSPSVGGNTGTAGQAGVGGPGAGGSTGAAGQANAGSGGAGAGGQTASGGATGAAGGGAGTAGSAAVPPTGPCAPPDDIYSPIEELSQTGCMDPVTLTKFVSRAVPYEVNSPLWSDGATKTRAFVLPAGGKIHVRDCQNDPGECPQGAADDGKWVFPVGTVMIKNFMFDGKLVETRLFMHQSDDPMMGWVGYGYEWNEAQTEATIAPTDRDLGKPFNTGMRTVTWNYPSRMDCLTCHDYRGGSTIGPETAQLNRVVGAANQIDTFASMSLFDTPPAKPYKAALVVPYAGQAGTPPAGATLDQKARSYMHANCSFCHRPQGQFPNFDLRFDTPLAMASICNVATKKTAPTITATKIMVPGDHASSAMWQRMHSMTGDDGRMPAIGSYVVDDTGTQLVADWIDSIATCP